MTKFALYVPLQAKSGKEEDVASFLRSAVPLVNAEPGTVSWFAIKKEHHGSPYSTRLMTKLAVRRTSVARWQRR